MVQPTNNSPTPIGPAAAAQANRSKQATSSEPFSIEQPSKEPRNTRSEPQKTEKTATDKTTPAEEPQPKDEPDVATASAIYSLFVNVANVVPEDINLSATPEEIVEQLTLMVQELGLEQDPELQKLLEQLQDFLNQNDILLDSQKARTPQDFSVFDDALHDAIAQIKKLLQDDPASLHIILEKEPFINIKPLFTQTEPIEQPEQVLETENPIAPIQPQRPERPQQQAPKQEEQTFDRNTPPPMVAFADRLPTDAKQPVPSEFAALRESVFEQAVEQMVASVQNGQQQITIQLRPEFLGSMTIELMMTQNGLSARLNTSDPHVQSMMSEQIAQLQTQLQERGINVVQMEVVYSELNDSRFQQTQDFQQSQQSHPQSSGQSGRLARIAVDLNQLGINMYDALAAGQTMTETESTVEYLA